MVAQEIVVLCKDNTGLAECVGNVREVVRSLQLGIRCCCNINPTQPKTTGYRI